jgi:hypothetical protein
MVTRARPVALVVAVATMLLPAIAVGALGRRGDVQPAHGFASTRPAVVADIAEVRATPVSRDEGAEALRGRARFVAVGVSVASAVASAPLHAVTETGPSQSASAACRVRCARAPPRPS